MNRLKTVHQSGASSSPLNWVLVAMPFALRFIVGLQVAAFFVPGILCVIALAVAIPSLMSSTQEILLAIPIVLLIFLASIGVWHGFPLYLSVINQKPLKTTKARIYIGLLSGLSACLIFIGYLILFGTSNPTFWAIGTMPVVGGLQLYWLKRHDFGV